MRLLQRQGCCHSNYYRLVFLFRVAYIVCSFVLMLFRSYYLQGLLEGVSDAFTKNFHFIDSVKAYLSYALLRACVSSSPVVFQVKIENLSILIFIILDVTVLIDFKYAFMLNCLFFFDSMLVEFFQFCCSVLERV